MAFLDTLPTPVTLIGPDGQLDAVSGRAGPGFAQINFISVEPTQHSKAMSGRYDMSRAANPHFWRMDIAYNELLCEDFHVIYPFLLRKQESMQPFYVELPQYFNQGISDKSVHAPGGWGFNTIVVNVGTEHVEPGMAFTSPNSDKKLYVVTRVETETDYYNPIGTEGEWSYGSSREILHVSPTFQSSITSGNLDFTSPKLKVRLDSDLAYTVGANNLYSFGITVEEIE